jgi:hypothetical protein
VIAAAEAAGALFCKFGEYKDWVVESIVALRREE